MYIYFRLSFLNFLLGKQPNGPGQYIFGAVAPSSGKIWNYFLSNKHHSGTGQYIFGAVSPSSGEIYNYFLKKKLFIVPQPVFIG